MTAVTDGAWGNEDYQRMDRERLDGGSRAGRGKMDLRSNIAVLVFAAAFFAVAAIIAA